MVDGEPVEGDAVVIAMGPWSILAAAWLPLPAVYGLKGHSVVYDTGDAVPPEALFLEVGENGRRRSVARGFSRGRTAPPMSAPSPARARCRSTRRRWSPIPAPSTGSRRSAAGISPVLDPAKVIAAQACFRPVTADGLPLIGAIPGVAGAYVATGHSVWGMLNAPATGEAMAGLILDGRAGHVDLAPFDPGRLRPFDAARLATG